MGIVDIFIANIQGEVCVNQEQVIACLPFSWFFLDQSAVRVIYGGLFSKLRRKYQ